MKRFFYVRFFYLIVLMVLSSSAYAGHSFSFVVGRHRVHIEAPRHCHSPSCLSVSIPEIRETLDRYDNEAAPAAVAAKPLAAAPEAVLARHGGRHRRHLQPSRQPTWRGPLRTPLPGVPGSCARRTTPRRKRRSATG